MNLLTIQPYTWTTIPRTGLEVHAFSSHPVTIVVQDYEGVHVCSGEAFLPPHCTIQVRRKDDAGNWRGE